MNDKPIVFLDIDGVLNSRNFFYKSCAYERKDPRSQLDPAAITFLNEIADWNFVLSSTWRKFYSVGEMTQMLQEVGFRGTIIDSTPIMDWQGSLRGNEIRQYLRNTKLEDRRDYIIFDDDSDMLLWQREHFIHIDGYYGLSPNHVYKAKLFINRNETHAAEI